MIVILYFIIRIFLYDKDVFFSPLLENTIAKITMQPSTIIFLGIMFVIGLYVDKNYAEKHQKKPRISSLITGFVYVPLVIVIIVMSDDKDVDSWIITYFFVLCIICISAGVFIYNWCEHGFVKAIVETFKYEVQTILSTVVILIILGILFLCFEFCLVILIIILGMIISAPVLLLLLFL